MTDEIKVVLWDFDGVILDSMAIRDLGFSEIFKSFSKHDVDQLIEYHRKNGGLSRYVKIKYFFENIIGRHISEDEVQKYANDFSVIMKKMLVDQKNLITDSVEFIMENHKNYDFHIVSGSDGEELKFLCKELEISKYFISIHGSPTPKTKLVYNVIEKHGYDKKNMCLIGDSINDYDAATDNNIIFYGYNNKDFLNKGFLYIKCFENFKFNL